MIIKNFKNFKSNENIHKKEDGSYYVVLANKATSVKRRNEENLKRIKINNKEYKLSQHADDTQIILDRSNLSLKCALGILRKYYLDYQGAIAIRRIFSLVTHDYKDRIFKLVPNVRNLHGSVGKCINFLIGVTSQQFVVFKFVKICVFRTHPSFNAFTQETISIKEMQRYVSKASTLKCRW